MSNQGEFSTSAARSGRRWWAHSDATESARRVRRQDHVVVPVAVHDPRPRGVDVLEVGVHVVDVVGGLVLPQRAAVLPQVEGVEVVAAAGPPLRELCLEEVVGEAVHVEHRPAGRLVGRPMDEVGLDRPFRVGGQHQRLDDVRRPEHVGRQVESVASAHASDCDTRAASTSASNSRWSRAISGCHCTPRQKRSAARSIASTVPSSAQAEAT